MRAAAIATFAMLVSVAGCDDTLDVHLIPPPGETTTTIDYQCVNRLHVVAESAFSLESTETCIEIPSGTIDNLRNHHLDGLLAIDMPPQGLGQLEVRGVRTEDDSCTSVGSHTVFQGSAQYSGGWDLDIHLQHSLDCNDYDTAPTNAQFLDLSNLLTGTAATRCNPPPQADVYTLQLSLEFPVSIGAGYYNYVMESASAEMPVSAAGLATFSGPHFRRAIAPSCMSLYTANGPLPEQGGIPTAACVDDQQATLCGPAGTAEVIWYSVPVYNQISGAVFTQDFTSLSTALVWDAATRQPVAGATLARLDDRDDLGQAYFDFGGGGATVASGATATTASGLVALELDVSAEVLVSAPGYKARRVMMAIGSGVAGTSIPLRRE